MVSRQQYVHRQETIYTTDVLLPDGVEKQVVIQLSLAYPRLIITVVGAKDRPMIDAHLRGGTSWRILLRTSK